MIMNRMLQFAILIFWCSILYAQNIVVDGVTFSADKKTLIKYPVDSVRFIYNIKIYQIV